MYYYIILIGGGDHKNTSVANMAALIGIVDILKLARIVAFRNAPDGSYVKEVERMMSFFNLPLAGRGFARDPCPSDGIEKRLHRAIQ